LTKARLWLSAELRDHVRREFHGSKLLFRNGMTKDRDWSEIVQTGDKRWQYDVKGKGAMLDLWELPRHVLSTAREWATTNGGRYLEADGS